jgi:hypothetical protein
MMDARPGRNQQSPDILPLVPPDDPEQIDALARYWDATVRRQPTRATDLEPEMQQIVHVLRHYHQITRQQPVEHSPPQSSTRTEWDATLRVWRRGMLGFVAVMLMVLAIHTATSPRSWLSTTGDPDWVPWISDEWIVSVLTED